MNARRVAASGALVLGTAAILLSAVTVVEEFPGGLIVLACAFVASVGLWYAIVRRGALRWLSLGLGTVALTAMVILIVDDGGLKLVLASAAIAGTNLCARAAFAARVHLRPAPRPAHPVLFMNPLSGGGKAERFDLAERARERGIEPIVFGPGRDLETLVRRAVAEGADALAAAGGDGSQATVAAIAAELDLPYACIPSGTRNHFALDLGVDRDDVVGALDAFVDGGERRVDLGEVNGRVFVNNVSLGVYAQAVQQDGYREAKLRTLVATLADWQRADRDGDGGLGMSWTGPGGHEHRFGAAILVSNNRYRLGRAVGSGTRPRINDGLLGITVAGMPADPSQEERARRLQRPWREWTAESFEVDAERPVAAGIDGEAAMLKPPLRFRIRPGALRVRIARAHPGASPSYRMPERGRDALLALFEIALGREPAVASSPARPVAG